MKTLAFGIAFAATCCWGAGEGPAKVRGLLWLCMVVCALLEKPIKIEITNEFANKGESK